MPNGEFVIQLQIYLIKFHQDHIKRLVIAILAWENCDLIFKARLDPVSNIKVCVDMYMWLLRNWNKFLKKHFLKQH